MPVIIERATRKIKSAQSENIVYNVTKILSIMNGKLLKARGGRIREIYEPISKRPKQWKATLRYYKIIVKAMK